MQSLKRTMIMLFLLPLMIGTGVYGDSLQKTNAPNIEITVQGEVKPLSEGQNVVLVNDRAYVPLRYFSEALNVDAGWHGGRKVAFVGQTPDWEAVDAEPAAEAEPLMIRFYFEGTKREIPAGLAIFVEENMPYVPIRYMAESLGKEVTWKPGTDKHVISIRTVN